MQGIGLYVLAKWAENGANLKVCLVLSREATSASFGFYQLLNQLYVLCRDLLPHHVCDIRFLRLRQEMENELTILSHTLAIFSWISPGFAQRFLAALQPGIMCPVLWFPESRCLLEISW